MSGWPNVYVQKDGDVFFKEFLPILRHKLFLINSRLDCEILGSGRTKLVIIYFGLLLDAPFGCTLALLTTDAFYGHDDVMGKIILTPYEGLLTEIKLKYGSYGWLLSKEQYNSVVQVLRSIVVEYGLWEWPKESAEGGKTQ